MTKRLAPLGLGLCTLVLFAASLAHAGNFSTTAWTDDASTGIVSGQTVWAYHFGVTTVATVNGVSVTGVAGPTASNANFTLAGTDNVYNADDNNLTALTGTGSAVIAHDFVLGGFPTLTLNALTVGQTYTVSFLSVGWEAAGTRVVDFASGSDSLLVDQGEFGDNNGIRVDYTFVATAATRAISITSANVDGATFHFYGLALRTGTALTTVTNTNDSGTGSLRWALANAADQAGVDTVIFDAALNGATVTLGSEIVINDATGEVTIDATSLPAGMTIDGGPGPNRIFTLDNGTSLSLNGLTLTGGNPGGNGGAISVANGTLTLSRCTLNGNSAASGGAIAVGSGAAFLSQCTLCDNVGGLVGGALSGTGIISLTHCTVSGNRALSGGGINFTGSSLTLVNSIVAGNTANNSPDLKCGSLPTVIGINFVGDVSGSGLAAGSGAGNSFIVTGDPLLAPLASNGGPTPTMALRAGSLAIDTTYPDTGLTTDQRGFPRYQGGVSDLGAFESNTIVVTTTADELDTPSSGGAGISLREAVRDAPDLVMFAPGFTGPVVLGSEIVVSDTTRTIAIDAGSLPSGLTIDGGPGTNRIFSVSAGSRLSLRSLTLTGGNGDGAAQIGDGNAIVNFGTLTLQRCTLSGNTRATGNGGAIYQAAGTATLTNCTLVGNQSGIGGAIAISSLGKAALTNCTLVGNQAGIGGAITISSLGKAALTNCTVFGNKASTGGGVFADSGLTLVNTIIAGNSATSFAPDLNSSGVNVSGVNFIGNHFGSGLFPGSTLLTGDPLLGPLASNGGPTQTMAPRVGSPVLDAATTVAGLTTDQRGFPRNRDGDGNGTAAPDIGAFEASNVVVTTAADELDAISSGGAGISLREAMRDAPDLVTFAPGFTGPLVLGSEIVVPSTTRSITIDAGSLPSGLTIDGGPGTHRIFTVSSGCNLSLTGFTLTGGNGAGLTSNGNGGAILNSGSLTLTRCTLAGNAAGFVGGAIFSNGGTLMLTQCTLSGNASGGYGGAIFQVGGTATLTQCTLSSNTAQAGGGAIDTSGAAVLTECTFYGNSALTGGACFGTGTLTFTHCTLSGNAAKFGGALYITGSATLIHCIVAKNTASLSGPDLVVDSGGTLAATGVNLVGDLAGSGLTAGPTILTGDPLLRPLANNGGPTQTMALRSGSPAIDAVPPDSEVPGLTTDQRGFPRNFTGGDGNPSNFRPDLGAFELFPSFVTTAVDELDAVSSDGAGVSLREALRDYAGQDTIAFSFPVEGHTIVLSSPLEVTADVRIDGGNLTGGATVSGNNAVRVFHIASGVNASFARLTITGGSISGNGAGVLVEGALALTECSLTGNSASAGGGAAALAPNGASMLTLDRCTVSGNTASNGGGIQNEGTLVCINSTFANNTATAQGGAISAPSDKPVTLRHCTVSLNTAATGGGMIGNAITLENSIVAGNTAPSGPNISGTPTLIGTNLTSGDPILSLLGDFGGPTETMHPVIGSPAIDQASMLGSPLTTDQRGQPRPLGLRPDIGAVEATFIIVTTPVDELDPPGSPGAGVSLREAIRDIPADGAIVFDRAIFTGATPTANTITLTKGPLNPQRYCVIYGGLNPGGIKIVNTLTITQQPLPQSVASNSPANFLVNVTAVSGGLTYRWRKNGQNIATTTAALAIASAQESDEGVYDVVVSEEPTTGSIHLLDVIMLPATATSQPASLIVDGAPVTIKRHPSSAMLALGSNYTLRVDAIGPAAPALTYQWTKAGKNISGATRSAYPITNAQLSHAGAYTCIVKSGTTLPGVTSTTAEIGVVDARLKTVNLALTPTSTFTASVSAAGNGPLTFAWLRNGSLIGKSDKTFTIPVTVSEAGLYTCTVTGLAGVFTGGAPTQLNLSSAVPTLVTPLQLPAATIGQYYFYQIPVTDTAGAPATSFLITGALPSGMTYSKTTGIISGRPTTTKPLGYPLTIKAGNAKGFGPSAPATLMVNVVPPTALGIFAGVIERSSLFNDSLGGRFDLTTSGNGTFSGGITLGTRKKLPFTAKLLQSAGTGDVILYGSIPGITLADKTALIAYVEIFAVEQRAVLTLVHPDGTSLVVPAWRNPWLLSKTPALNNPATPFAAAYTARLDAGIGGTAWPSGYGYTSFTVKPDGTLTLAGKLPDGSAITGGTFVSKDGEILLFNLLYSNRNTHVGQLVITPASPVTNNTLAGATSWWKPAPLANSTDTIYKGGFFGVPVTFAGAPYVAPGKGAIVPGFTAVAAGSTNAKLNFTLGGLDTESKEFTQLLRIASPSASSLTNTATIAAPVNSTKVSLFTAKTGLFSGSFTIPGATKVLNRPAPFFGQLVKINGVTEGYGYFLLPKVPVGTEKVKTSPKLSGRVVLGTP